MKVKTITAALCAALTFAANAHSLPDEQAQRYARGTQAGLRALERAFMLHQLDALFSRPGQDPAAPAALSELVPEFGFAPNASLGIAWAVVPTQAAESVRLCARLNTDDAAALRGFLQGAHAARAHRVDAADCATRTNVWQPLPATVAVALLVHRPKVLVEADAEAGPAPEANAPAPSEAAPAPVAGDSGARLAREHERELSRGQYPEAARLRAQRLLERVSGYRPSPRAWRSSGPGATR